MSITLLLEKYDVSTDEGLQKALEEIEKEETEVDEALSGALSRACALEGKLRTASQAYTKLGEVKNDGLAASDMVERTAALARDVSAKVRQLDLARSRVAECQRRVHDLIDLQLCSAGVEAAIKAHDYETGAAHVARFLSMDPGSVAAARARGAPDPRHNMAKAADTLREQLKLKFEDAARKADDAAVDRLFKLFPQLGRAEEGVELLAKYLAKNLEGSVRRGGEGGGGGGGAEYADALTRLLEAAAAALQRVRAASRACAAPGLLPRALAVVQPQVCAGGRRVAAALVAARAAPGGGAADARAVEPALAELALSHSRIYLYFGFLRRNAEADASSLKESERAAVVNAVEKIIADCDLNRTAQDLLSHYLTLERYFLEESINKAMKMSSGQSGATTSSLVDDVFFIARKVIRRAISTGSVEGTCAVLNEVCAALERPAAAALRRDLRAAPRDALPLAPPAPAASAAASASAAAALIAQRLSRDLDSQRQLFLARTNEAECGAEWAERLADEAVAQAEAARLVRAGGGGDLEKLASCAAGLAGAAAAFRAARDLALAALAADLAAPARAWAHALVAPRPDDDDSVDDADALPAALDAFAEAARAHLSARTAEGLVASVVIEIASRADEYILRNSYTREAGVRVERGARRLAAWCGAAAGGARERVARLTRAAALLALETPAQARLALPASAALAPQDVRDVLARRVDFKIEDIKRLKL